MWSLLNEVWFIWIMGKKHNIQSFYIFPYKMLRMSGIWKITACKTEPSNDSNIIPPGFRYRDQYRLRTSNQNIFFFNLKAECDGNIWIQMPLASVTYVNLPPIIFFFSKYFLNIWHYTKKSLNPCVWTIYEMCIADT